MALAKRWRRLCVAMFAVLLLGLLLGRLEAGRATNKDLGGDKRFLTAISTDKPIYRPGEKVYVRGVVLNAFDRTPLPNAEPAWAVVEIKGPKGETVASGWTQSQDSVWSFAWDVPTELAGGEYTLKATYPNHGHAPAERKFDIRRYRAPRLKSQIVFLRDGYGPGDKVTATLSTTRAEGGVPEGAKVTAVARVDEAEVARVEGRVDSKGNCTASFELPKEIARGEGSLAFVIEDGGVVETATKTLPILIQTVDIKFYPEGGDLVAGSPNRVYFEARRPDGKPADIEGVIECNNGRGGPMTVVALKTEHEGRGLVEFTPDPNREAYVLRITKPSGIKKRIDLPASKASGAILRMDKTVFSADEPISLTVMPRPIGKKVKATLSQREREIDSTESWRTREAGVDIGKLDAKDAAGVLTVTLWGADGQPLAERLIYRQPKDALNIQIVPDRNAYVPGDTAKLTVKTTRGGKPVGAVVGLAVRDESILEMIDKREQAPRLPAMVLLEGEVSELADAHVYLDSSNPKAAVAMDLLLGTQGWRRFALMDLPKFLEQYGDAARRAVALRLIQPQRHGGLGGGCFPAGTLVQTVHGPQAIESVQAGEKVLACDPATGTWCFKPVVKTLCHAYDGDLISVCLEGLTFEATGNHPFWVVRGANLVARPQVMDLSAANQGISKKGRWVEARDLRAGDELLSVSGTTIPVLETSSRQARLPVFNLQVDGLHTYAVSESGVLVHNKDAAEPEFDGAIVDQLAVVQNAAPEDPAAPPAAEPRMIQAEQAGPADKPVQIAGDEMQDAKKPREDRTKLREALDRAEAAEERIARWAGNKEAEMQSTLLVVREFAHQARPDRKPNDRRDFAETLYWNAGLKTDDKTGEVIISFALNDSVTTFAVAADGFDASGALGEGTLKIESVQPFYVEPKLPVEVTSGDLVRLPVNFVNGIASELPGVRVTAEADEYLKISGLEPFDLGAMQRMRKILDVKVGQGNGEYKLALKAEAAPYADTVTRTLRVKPLGFPIEAAFGGLLDARHAGTHKLSIPKEVVPHSVRTKIAVYPTPLANLTEALQRLIQDPNGCFEQTSSTSYPLTMAQQYFLSHTNFDTKLVEQSRQKLDAGYKRLVSFWCPDRGYEWFGENPGHEALTAFGLLHFGDMAQVREVDRNMVEQTRAWLLKQRDGKGGFERKRRALHTWIEDRDCSNAYILWALLETGEPAANLVKEVSALKETAAKSTNSYVVALAANALYLAGEKDAANGLMQRLADKQKADGSVDKATASIVGSEGVSLAVEATALAVLAWMREDAFAGSVEKAMKFLADSCQSGRYGSTQSTVLALRAIVTYDRMRARPKAAGRVRVLADGQTVGGWADFTPETKGAIDLPDVSELLASGDHTIEVKMENGAQMPYSVSVTYNTLTPNSSDACKVGLKVALTKQQVAEGETLEANATVTNLTDAAIPTPVAIVGLPGGLEPRHDQLKELVKKGVIDAYEVLGREVVLYWRGMNPKQTVEVPLSLVAAVPGTYTGPASRAYLYYTDEHKNWVDGLNVEVTPK